MWGDSYPQKIVIELPGEPCGKERPRLGKHGNVYTPSKTAAYERSLGWAAKIAMKGQKPLLGPLMVTVTAFMGIPPSWPHSARMTALGGLIRPTRKPDWDNVGKIAADALNGIAYVDDSQIVTATVSKVYAATPALRIEIEPVAEKKR